MFMNDTDTTLATLREQFDDFVSERDWHQFHSPKNLAMALTIEAGELMEHFQWLTQDESRRINGSGDKLNAVSEEIADVLCYTIAIANQLQIDLSQAFSRKMEKNRLKYPVESYRGRFGDEDSRPVSE